MPQVAQQDYIYHVTIADTHNPTSEEKKALWDLVERGTIWDAIIICPQVKTRVAAVAEDDYLVIVAFDYEEQGAYGIDCTPDD